MICKVQVNRVCHLFFTALRETIAHNGERGNPVHVVVLDSRKAFDQVWVDGLFSQLYHMGITLAYGSCLGSFTQILNVL